MHSLPELLTIIGGVVGLATAVTNLVATLLRNNRRGDSADD
jgi:hypothetical protein